MPAFAGSIELKMLLLSVLLGILHLVATVTLAIRDQGFYYVLGTRERASPPLSILAQRVTQAFANFKETFVFFATAVLTVMLLSKHSDLSAVGAELYFYARLAYVFICAAGIPLVRTGVWGLSMLGILFVLASAIN